MPGNAGVDDDDNDNGVADVADVVDDDDVDCCDMPTVSGDPGRALCDGCVSRIF